MKRPAVLVVVALASLGFQERPAPKPAAPAARPSPTPAPVLEGMVKGPDAKPVEKALVLVRPSMAMGSEAPLHARTDAAGRFRIELKSGRPHEVRVEAPGLAAHRLDKVRPGNPLMIVLGRGAAIEGTVRDSQTGAPVARARVTARDEGGIVGVALSEPDAGLVQAVTDGKGQFRLEGLAPGLHTLAARAGAGYGRQGGVRTGTRVELLLMPGATIFGRVTGRQGQPVSGASVSAQREERAALPPEAPIERTDSAGLFEVAGLAAGTYSLTVNHFAPSVRVGLSVERDTATSTDVALEAGSRVTGRLVSDAGRPLAGQIAVQEVEGREAPRSFLSLARARAAADGRFELPRLAPSSYVLAAGSPGYASQRVEVLVPPQRVPAVDVGDVALETGIAIRGRVRDPAGSAVAGAEVRARTAGRPFGGVFATAEAQSEADGTFVLAGLSDGSYQVAARAAGHAAAGEVVPAGSSDVEIVLPAAGAITGVVVDETDRPVEGSRVSAEPAARSSGFPLFFAGPGRPSGSDGAFTLEDLAEGAYAVQAAAPELAARSVPGVKVIPGRTTDVGRIRLGKGGTVRGTVASAAGGAVGGAIVFVRPTGGEWNPRGDRLTAVTNSAGSFEIRGVPAGSADVLATHPRHAPASVGVEVDPAKGAAEARLVLTEGGRIEGWARKRDGTPLSGRIQVTASQFRPGRGRPDMVPVQPSGSFLVEHVDPGPVQVTLLAGAGSVFTSVLSREVEVREGETTVVDMTSREILVTGQVTRGGIPVPRVRVSLSRRGSGRTMTTMTAYGFGPSAPPPASGPPRGTTLTGEDGRYELLVDEPGEARLWVESLDGETQLAGRREAIPDADTHLADFAVGGVAVTGVVIDRQTESPVSQVQLSALQRQGPERGFSDRTGANGRFKFELDPGDYRLTATAEGYAPQSLEVTVGEEGLEDLRVTLTKDATGPSDQ